MSAENHVINYDKSVKDLTSTFQQHESSVELIVKKYKDLNTQLSSLPSDFVTKLRDITKANDDMVKSQNKLNNATNEALKQSKLKAEAEIKELDAIIKKLKVEQEELKIKLQKANLSAKEAREVQNATNATNKAIVALEKANNTYNKIQAKINGTSQAYNNLAAKKQLGLDLSAKEERMLAIYQARLLRYNSILKDIDANIGKHQRNVGNYAGAWNPLNNAVNQLTRELPNAGISFQTFAMSITNNIGAMQDAIADLRAKNQQLIKDGQPTKSIIGQVAGAFFSWNTVLYIGVGLFTAFSKEIAEFFKQAFKGTSTINGLKEAKKQFNDASMEGRKNAQQEIQELKVLIGVAQNTTLSTQQRTKAVDDLQSKFPGYFGNLEKEQILNGDLTALTKELTDALLARAIATASISKMTENASKILDLEEEKRLEAEKLKTLEKQAKTQAEITKNVLTTTTRDEAYTTGRLQTATTKVLSTKRQIANTDKEIIRLTEINTRLSEKAQVNQAKASKLGGGSKTSGETSVNGGKTKEQSVKDVKDQLELDYQLSNQLIENQIKVTESYTEQMTLRQQQLLLWYSFELSKAKDNQKQIDLINAEFKGKLLDLNKEEIKASEDKHSKKIKAEEKTADLVKKSWQKVTDFILNLIDEQVKAEQEATNKRRENFEDYATGGFSFGSMGFGSLDIFQDVDFMKNFFKSMEDSSLSATEKAAAAMRMFGSIANDVFAKLQASSQAYYENQFSLLEKEHETSIKYANNNVDAKTVLEEKYTARKLELKRQQAKQEKEMAIFQALINVATGITAALAQGGPVGFVLAALVGLLGAVQIESIRAQPLPQFYNGTMNASEGWAIVDELRPEVHTDKQGNVKSMGSSGGANLRYLEQGDKIYKSHADFFNEMDDATRFGGITIEKNDGLSKHDLEDVMQRVMNGIQQNSINLDVKGFTTYQGRRNSRNRILNKKVRFGK